MKSELLSQPLAHIKHIYLFFLWVFFRLMTLLIYGITKQPGRNSALIYKLSGCPDHKLG